MSAEVLSGKGLAGLIRQRAQEEAHALDHQGVRPTVAVVVATDDESTHWYVRSIERAAERAGIDCRIVDLGHDATVLRGEASAVTSNRLELMAAAQVLAALPERATVDWRGGSDYLREGASKWLDGWRRRGWRTSGGEPVKNADLWQRLQAPLAARRIRFRPATEADREDLATLARVVKERLDGGGR